jgi:hypothetical protein
LSLHQFSQQVCGRTLFGGHVDSVSALAMELIRPGEHFVLFVAVDTCAFPERTLGTIAASAVRAGASYVCCWGPECSRFHTVLDRADGVRDGTNEDQVILTDCQQGRPLEQALAFAVHGARPGPRFEASTRSVIAVAIANPAWASRIETCLAARRTVYRRGLSRTSRDGSGGRR